MRLRDDNRLAGEPRMKRSRPIDRSNKTRWDDHWIAGLTDEHLLGEVLAALPGDAASDIPLVVRALENPASPIALPGAINLFGHDCVHVLLGRGLTQRAEAFVVGFTMGSATANPALRVGLFPWLASVLYPGIYRFQRMERAVFSLGVECARSMGCEDLSAIHFEGLLSMDIKTARGTCAIDERILRKCSDRERQLFPEHQERAF
jgi:hypothetical protein